MTTFSPIASIWSLANAISSVVAAAVAGSTRPTVSPGVNRLGLTGERRAGSGGAGEAAGAAPTEAAAAVSETRRANSRRSMAPIYQGCWLSVVRIGPSQESRQRAKEEGRR